MQNKLKDALSERPWALLRIVYGHGAVVDDEGRPLSEGRAPSEFRSEVPMVRKRCPYKDERLDRPMNVSALAQMTKHLDVVLRDIEAFRSGLGPHSGWEGVSATLMYQMSQPALWLLRARNERMKVPACVAVAFKLAAGYTNPIREILTAQASGQAVEFSLAELNRRTRAGGYLVGAREVCAAPDALLDRVSSTYLCRPGDAAPRRRLLETPSVFSPTTEAREIAHLLMLQVHLGICWEIYDEGIERRLLLETVRQEHRKPQNQYVRRQVLDRETELARAPTRSDPTLSSALPPDVAEPLRAMLAGRLSPGALSVVEDRIKGLVDQGTSALRVDAAIRTTVVAELFVRYLFGYCAFCRACAALEHRVRAQLKMSAEPSVHLGGVLGQPKAMRWFELMFGYRFRMGRIPYGELLLRNKEGTQVRLPEELWSCLEQAA